jgi:uncharacterized membrane protein YqiK
MQSVIDFLSNWWWIFTIILLFPFSKIIFGWVMIGDDENGIVTRKWGGGELPPGRIIATNKESGIWAQMLSPGLKFWYWPWMYKIEKQKIFNVGIGEVAFVEAIDGEPLPPGVILSRIVPDCNNFQDAVAFLEGKDGQKKGQKGIQLGYLSNGSYRINQKLFNVTTSQGIEIPGKKIGIVEVFDGVPLDQKTIAGKIIEGHQNFQDARAFLSNGGSRGLQEQILQSGKYFINPRFAKVEVVNMTEVGVGNCLLINSFIGEDGQDVSGADFKHGNIVKRGQKGIWEETLDPGLHPINTKLQETQVLPTSNIVLNWDSELDAEHGYDENLGTIQLRSKDGFSFSLKLAQVIHVSNKNWPKVIARFGSIENLIEQVLEPLIGTYFRNSAQTRDALDFIENRTQIQEDAKKHINEQLEQYDVEGVDTLIGEIVPPEQLMEIRAEQKVAEEQKNMFKMQTQSEEERKGQVAATTAANMQENLTKAEFEKKIASTNAETIAIAAEGAANAKKKTADGDAYVFITVGTAEATNIREVGGAKAEVTEKNTKAMGTKEFAQVEMVRHLAENGIKITPDILVQGQTGSGDSGILAALIGKGLLDDLNRNKGTEKKEEVKEPASTAQPGSPEASSDGGLKEEKKD